MLLALHALASVMHPLDPANDVSRLAALSILTGVVIPEASFTCLSTKSDRSDGQSIRSYFFGAAYAIAEKCLIILEQGTKVPSTWTLLLRFSIKYEYEDRCPTHRYRAQAVCHDSAGTVASFRTGMASGGRCRAEVCFGPAYLHAFLPSRPPPMLRSASSTRSRLHTLTLR